MSTRERAAPWFRDPHEGTLVDHPNIVAHHRADHATGRRMIYAARDHEGETECVYCGGSDAVRGHAGELAFWWCLGCGDGGGPGIDRFEWAQGAIRSGEAWISEYRHEGDGGQVVKVDPLGPSNFQGHLTGWSREMEEALGFSPAFSELFGPDVIDPKKAG